MTTVLYPKIYFTINIGLRCHTEASVAVGFSFVFLYSSINNGAIRPHTHSVFDVKGIMNETEITNSTVVIKMCRNIRSFPSWTRERTNICPVLLKVNIGVEPALNERPVLVKLLKVDFNNVVSVAFDEHTDDVGACTRVFRLMNVNTSI